MARERRNILFSGRVQGVGFRFTACRAAGGYDITGYVRNLPDGSVECLVEGDRAEIDGFLEALEQRMQGYVRRRTEQTAPHSGAWRTFDVRF